MTGCILKLEVRGRVAGAECAFGLAAVDQRPRGALHGIELVAGRNQRKSTILEVLPQRVEFVLKCHRRRPHRGAMP